MVVIHFKRFEFVISLFLIIILIPENVCSDDSANKELEAEKFLIDIESNLSLICNKGARASFDYFSNVTNETAQVRAAVSKENTESNEKLQKLLLHLFPDWKKFSNENVRYQLKFLLLDRTENVTKEDQEKLLTLQNEVSTIHATATICEYQNKSDCQLRVHPDIVAKLRSVNNLVETKYYWTEWHDTIGKMITPKKYEELTSLYNLYAKVNGYHNEVESWLTQYDDHSSEWTADRFLQTLMKLMEQYQPYFNKFHAYVRMQLRKIPEFANILPQEGYLPVHLLGSLLGHEWTAVAKLTMPFPNAPAINVTQALENANFTPIRIVQEAENFFKSLNADRMPDSFWKKSLFERPADRHATCHPAAFDFCSGDDYRLHQCIKVNEGNLLTAYHELGHLVYFMQYRHLPFAFRNGANPGFHEAIGDTIALSVTPKHLKCSLGLEIPNGNNIKCGHVVKSNEKPTITEQDVNVLYQKALSKLAFIPFGLSVDLWRLKVYNGSISREQYNTEWWKIRQDLNGIVPPSPRNPDMLDPASIFHVASNIPYSNYFVSHILQFQFYEAMCRAAGEYDSNDENSGFLHQCDFSNSEKAGKLLKDMLKQGSSKDWRSILESFTGSREISLNPLIHYFRPLFDHIERELAQNKEPACFGVHC